MNKRMKEITLQNVANERDRFEAAVEARLDELVKRNTPKFLYPYVYAGVYLHGSPLIIKKANGTREQAHGSVWFVRISIGDSSFHCYTSRHVKFKDMKFTREEQVAFVRALNTVARRFLGMIILRLQRRMKKNRKKMRI